MTNLNLGIVVLFIVGALYVTQRAGRTIGLASLATAFALSLYQGWKGWNP